MKNKLLFLILSIAFVVIFSGCLGIGGSKKEKQVPGKDNIAQSTVKDERVSALETMFRQYIQAWQSSDFKTMYSFAGAAAKNSISEEDFITKYTNIYKGIQAENLSVEAEYPDTINPDDFERVAVQYDASLETVAGTVDFSGTAMFREEETDGQKQWKLLWTPSMIFPDMDEGDLVKVVTKSGSRGEITDRNGKPLAVEGLAAEIGIVPKKLGEAAGASKESVSKLLGISVDSIDKKLSASYVKPDMFIPIKVISRSQEALLAKLREIKGVLIRDKKVRSYPLGEKAAHLTGYVQQINADELKQLEAQGYTSQDVIGKVGLEKIYEENFRPEDGAEIYIEDKLGNKKKVIAEKDSKDTSNLRLAIDADIQSTIYDELKQDKGVGIAVNPKTGEVLALVSTPSYDPNSFVLGMSSDEWNKLNTDPSKPLFNRFQATFSPGSSFKPITAAIGLKTSKLDPAAALDISGLKWQKNSSWGNYSVTRSKEYNAPSNLLNAMIYSDNIYFARAALNIGSQDFLNEVGNLGIGEEIPFDYPLTRSQFDSDGVIKNEIQLADSGYGQGEVLMNPLQLAMLYGAFVNGGTIMKPRLQVSSVQPPEAWKSNVFSPETVNTVLQAMVQVVQNPEGTGHEAYIKGLTLAGKTGTAEVKLKQGSTTGTELGWFAAVDTANPDLLVLMMVEDVKGRGGSHYVVPKVKHVMEKFAGK